MLQPKSINLLENINLWLQLGNFLPHYKRVIFIPILLLGAEVLGFDLILTVPTAFELFTFILSVAMIAAMVAVALLLWRHVPRQELLLLGLFLGACMYIVILMTYQTPRMSTLLSHSGLGAALSPWLIWLVVLVVSCFFTFRAITALRASLLMSALTLGGAGVIFFQMRWTGFDIAHDLITLTAAIAMIMLFVYQMARTQERSSQTDFLTGLPNRMRCYDVLDYELQRAARSNTLFAVILFDLDHFKKVNDQYGHPTGDAVLCDFANFVQQHIRRADTLARWGGEEFILIMPGTDLASGRLKADHLRQQIKNRAFTNGIRISSSFGVTAYYMRDTNATLLERADAALYRAKANGRNCVETE